MAGSVVLTLTTDDPVGPCLSNSDDMILNFSDPATLTVNTPVISCIGETVPLTSIMGGTGTVITWSNGGGVFSDINSETPIYTPSIPEEDANLVSLLVTVADPDAAGPCLDVSLSLIHI